jgi:HD superfamily phosphohydrolase
MWHEVRDPVHNFILFDDFEKRLIDSEPVQRLKHIKQLALTCEVYPGATHSRFEHSLGTMELATQAFDTIVRKDPDVLRRLGWSDLFRRSAYREVLRIAALLHDIGHAPFSHAAKDLLPAGSKGHESLSEAFIRSDYIAPLLRAAPVNFDPDQVVAVVLGPEKSLQEDPSLQLLQELLAGDLGADRMDYLVRDALHTGATAGRFDYHRLLNTLTVIEHPTTGTPVLALEAGGLHAAEGLLLARYFMFLQVYFHDVRRIYDVHLADFLSAYLPHGRFPRDLNKYIEYTDETVHAAIANSAGQTGGSAEVASRLVGRSHYRLADEVTAQDKLRDPDIFDKLTGYVSGLFGDLVRTDEAGKEAQTLDEGRLYIVRDDGTMPDILDESELILSLRPIWKGRVYAHREVLAEVGKACREFLQ